MKTKQITVIGLGAGDLNQLPLGIYRRLTSTQERLICRTQAHPAVADLLKEGVAIECLDHFYEDHEDFETTYAAIVTYLLDQSQEEALTYLVPGHPLVAEDVVQKLIHLAQNDATLDLVIVGGQSFIDATLTAVQFDPIAGLALLNGENLESDQLPLDLGVVIAQVYDQFVLSNVKVTLLEQYPAEHSVAIVSGAGLPNEVVKWVPLAELDHDQEGVDNLRSLFVPPLEVKKQVYSLANLARGMQAIVAKDLWLNQQDTKALLAYLQEEVGEFIEAVQADDEEGAISELGDILYVWFCLAHQSQEDYLAGLDEVVRQFIVKMYRRHPHVFDDVQVNSVEELQALWQEIKLKEQADEIR